MPQLACRPGTHDHHVVDEVYTRNCYRLPDDMTGAVVIDVGAHIGTFASACLDRGAKLVVSVEADPSNYAAAMANLRRYGSRSFLIHAAVVGDAYSGWFVYMDREPAIFSGFAQTGGQNIFAKSGVPVLALQSSFMYSIAAQAPIDLLKLDCEGAEHQILASQLPWQSIGRVVGELHRVVPRFPDRDMSLDGQLNVEFNGAVERLTAAGFNVELAPFPSDPDLCLFFAGTEEAS